MTMRVACLLLLAGCDYLFQVDHVPDPPVDADTTDALDAFEAGAVIEIDAGAGHTCVRIGASVRCFGAGQNGRLGYANSFPIGDNELPSSQPFVDVGDDVISLATGEAHTCAVTKANTVSCWGSSLAGRLGIPGTTDIGDNESPASAGAVPVGIAVTKVVAGIAHTCVLGDGEIRCWGHGQYGQLGYASTENLGDNEPPRDRSER
jgi:alpha-tubulin suppressor-like RCC1 family protein